MQRTSKPREPYRSTSRGSGSEPSLQVVCACSSASSAPVRVRCMARVSPGTPPPRERKWSISREDLDRARFAVARLHEAVEGVGEQADGHRPQKEPAVGLLGRARAARRRVRVPPWSRTPRRLLTRKAPIRPNTTQRARCPRIRPPSPPLLPPRSSRSLLQLLVELAGDRAVAVERGRSEECESGRIDEVAASPV